jgi:tripartite-type tricarboxylate transporter receptor subunit TctC
MAPKSSERLVVQDSSRSRRRFLKITAATLAMPALLRTGLAADWPTEKPIRAIVPFTPGSTIDLLGRIVLNPVSHRLGQTIVVENKAGAGGTIGSAQVAKADPDGYTFLINASAHSAAPAAYPHINYDPAADFAGVAMFGSVPNVFSVAPSSGINTIQDLAAKAKASGNMTYASAGVGSATHWAAERFRLSAGFKATHVPFRGGPEALTEVMTGRVDFCCIGITSTLPLVRDKRLTALAVSTPKRSVALPDVPTTLEAGFKDSDYTFWNGILVPAKTPRAIIDRLHAETVRALAIPEVQAKLEQQGVEPMPLNPEEFDALIKHEIASNLALAKAAGLKFN